MNGRVDIKERLRQDLRPRRPLAPEWMYTALFTALAASPALVLLALGATGWRSRAWSGLLPLLLSLLLAPWVGRALARLMAPGSAPDHAARLLALWFVATPAALLLSASRSVSWMPGRPEWHCYSSGVMVAVPGAVLAAILLARGHVLRRREAAAALGFLAGLAGYVALETACDLTGLSHLLVSHYTVPATLLAAAWVLALFRRRAS